MKRRLKLLKKLRNKVPQFAANVVRYYQIKGWEWGPEMTIPSVDDIQDCCYKLIKDLGADKRIKSINTGGLEVSYYTIDEDVKEVRLSFVDSEAVSE